MGHIYNNLGINFQEKIDKIIYKKNQEYFNNNVKELLINIARRKHVIRYIVNYYKEMYNILKKDLFEYIEYCFRDQYFVFMDKVFHAYSVIAICKKYNCKEVCNKIFNNLSYYNLKQILCRLNLCYQKEEIVV